MLLRLLKGLQQRPYGEREERRLVAGKELRVEESLCGWERIKPAGGGSQDTVGEEELTDGARSQPGPEWDRGLGWLGPHASWTTKWMRSRQK